MKVKKSNIPDDSLVSKYLPANYSDSFECEIPAAANLTPDDIQIAFWTKMPQWVEALFKLRNAIVKPFGLKSGDGDVEEFRKCIRTGGSCKFASVPDKSPLETVVCLDDKHLKAFLSIHIEKADIDRKIVRSITVVHFHNWLGYFYFYTIAPFHYVIVRNMLKYTLKRLYKTL